MRLKLPEIERRVGHFFGQLDAAIVRSLGDQPVSCRKGCAHCCYLATAGGIGEAIYIAAEVITWPDWREVARALHAHALEQTRGILDHAAWFDRHVPCPFLTAANTCRIYDRRPIACRTHLVKSPPENCALGAADPTTARYDANFQAMPFAVAVDLWIFQDHPELGRPFGGLVTHLVLWALQFYARGGDRKWLDKRLATLPTPQEWAERHDGVRIIESRWMG